MSGHFKDLLAAGGVIRVFVAGRLVHPVTIRMFGLAGGYQGFWLDVEHSGLTTEQLTIAGLAGRASGMACFVRMPVTNYAAVTQVLESEVDGVMAAQVANLQEAETFVRWAKFAPRGMRGLNPQGSDGNYSHKSPMQLAEDANREHFVAIQIELASVLPDVDKIAALDGVDLLFVGPFDLSQSLGVLGQTTHESVWAAIDSVAAACKRHGKAWGIVPAGPEYAQKCVDKGCRLLTCGSDVAAMKMGIQSIKELYAKQFAL